MKLLSLENTKVKHAFKSAIRLGDALISQFVLLSALLLLLNRCFGIQLLPVCKGAGWGD